MDPSTVANALVFQAGQSLSTAADDITQVFSEALSITVCH